MEGVYADLPDVVPPADVEGGSGHLPGGASVDVRELKGDVSDAGAPVDDAELAGARGDGLAILATHVRDARSKLRLRCPARTLPRRLCLAFFLLHLHRLTSARLPHLCHVHAPRSLFHLRFG